MRTLCHDATPDEIAAHFALADVEDFPPRYNIAPTQPILVVIAGAAARAGLQPAGAPRRCWCAGG